MCSPPRNRFGSVSLTAPLLQELVTEDDAAFMAARLFWQLCLKLLSDGLKEVAEFSTRGQRGGVLSQRAYCDKLRVPLFSRAAEAFHPVPGTPRRASVGFILARNGASD